ncbi:MAG: TlpA disulfide reductase family protein [Ignavibacteria bacterium]|jgi:peroxiredoxin
MKKVIILFVFTLFLTGFLKSQTYSDFTLLDLEGNEVTLSKLLDKGPVLIAFWATWCSPCKEEMKRVNEIYEKYKDKDFVYLAINQDNQKSVSKAVSYINAMSYTFPVVFDTDKRVFEAYSGKDEIPYSLLIGKNKEILSIHTGFKTGDEEKIEDEVKTALEQK